MPLRLQDPSRTRKGGVSILVTEVFHFVSILSCITASNFVRRRS